jgi:predicted permease
MRLAAFGPKYRQPPPAQPVRQFYQQIADRIARLPGVTSYGAVSVLPLTPIMAWAPLVIEGYTPAPGEELQIDLRIATAGYFHAMQVPLLKGRYFAAQDTPDAPPVVVVDEQMADRFWPAGDAIGRKVTRPNGRLSTVVGVVGRVKQYGLDAETKVVTYLPHAQNPSGEMFVVARVSADPSGLAAAIIREVRAVDADVPVYDVQTMEGRLEASLARRRFSMTMLAAFAGFALVLAIVGIYGVMSYIVAHGTHDIGIRIALGAQRSNILRMVMNQAMRLAGAGIAVGLIGAAALTRVMSTLLFGVSPTDAVTFSSIAVFLAVTALAASYVPALRATRVDPIVALREE